MSHHPLLLTLLITAGLITESAWAHLTFIDLTHEIPTFEPIPDINDPTKPNPDLSKPIEHSTPIAGFYQQAILYPADDWATNQGYFRSKAILIEEHNGTSFNSTSHYVNNEASLELGSNPNTHRKAAHQLTTKQLSGKIVLVDVSDRVKMELAKNGGKPSPDILVTDFSDASQATVRAADIAAIADQIEDGVWVVARVGWDQFYFAGTEDWDESEYVNALNHPGFTAEAIDKLIEIMDHKGVKISGIAADNFSTDSGEGAKGTDDNWSNAWPAHVRLYQRDILIVENLANLTELARVSRQAEDCYLMVGALKHVGGTGGPARVMATCEVEEKVNDEESIMIHAKKKEQQNKRNEKPHARTNEH